MHRGHLTIRVQEGIQILGMLRYMFGLPVNACVKWKPRGDTQVELPLFAVDDMPASGMNLQDVWLGPLVLDESRFYRAVQPVVVVLTPLGTFLLARQSAGTIEPVLMHLGMHIQGRLRAHNHLGHELEPDLETPDMLFVDAHVLCDSPDTDAYLQQYWIPALEELCMSTRVNTALKMLHLYTQLGITDDLKSLGWKVVLDIQTPAENADPHQAMLSIRQIPTAVSTTIQDMISLLATRLMYATLQKQFGANTTGLWVKVKLWSSFLWSGFVPQDCKADAVAVAWEQASRHFGRNDTLRTIVSGARVNPDWLLVSYIDIEQTEKRPTHIHRVQSLEGGGI